MIRAHQFEPLYFLPLAKAVRRAVGIPLVLQGGVKAMSDMQTAIDQGFELQRWSARAESAASVFLSSSRSVRVPASQVLTRSGQA